MLRILTLVLGLLCVAVPSRAAHAQDALKNALLNAMKTAEDALATAPIKNDGDISGLRLSSSAELRPNALNGYYKYTGLPQATAAFAGAKADLDRALALHQKVDGAVAATFLARYAWFRACYATQQINGRYALYPRERFQRLISQALAMDPNNPQAMLMRAFLAYCVHSHPWAKQVPETPPHCPVTEYGTSLSVRQQRRIIGMIQHVLHRHPHDFTAWLLLCRVARLNGFNVSRISKINIGLLSSSKHTDPFYFSFYPRFVPLVIQSATAYLKMYSPKLYEQYAGGKKR